MNARFVAAFSSVLAHDLDRRALLCLLRASHELRYEELRRAAREPSPQLFKYAVDRLITHALVNRRLVPQGKRFQSHFSPSARGLAIARVLEGLVRSGRLPQRLPPEVLADVRLVLEGATLPLSALPQGGRG
jgi:DNA-binding HxlR family transcriptional regulator